MIIDSRDPFLVFSRVKRLAKYFTGLHLIGRVTTSVIRTLNKDGHVSYENVTKQ